jgi:glycosyltransferase involved in cell wall biosynthesis
MAGDRILLFIPCYNCAPQIGRVLGQVRGDAAGFIDEVLVLDNGSRDGTVEAARVAKATVPVPTKIARNRDNYNLGGSHKAAYSYAAGNGFSHVVTLHGDDQGNLADLLPVVRSGDHRRFDACMGARFARGATLRNYSTFRIVGNRVFNAIFSVAARQHVTDMGSGLNMLGRSAFADARLLRLPDDLHFNPCLLLDLIGSGRAVHFFPISWREDDQVSNVKMASQALETLRAPLLYMFRRKSFDERDFRATPRTEYVFDVLD